MTLERLVRPATPIAAKRSPAGQAAFTEEAQALRS